jgi:nucleoside-diphosphate-sugar epimerase
LKNAVVAGAAGFIGSHLAEKLLENGYRVIAIDNFITGYKENLEKLLKNSKFRFLESDISEAIDLNESEIDLIFHLASPASPPKYFENPHQTIDANINGTMQLLSQAKKYEARLIFASTSEIYGDPLKTPQSEDYWGNVNSIGPRSIYDESKRMGETLCALAKREGQDVGVLRIFNTYGPQMDPYDGRVVSTFIRQAINKEAFTIQGSGKQTRSFCYINDLVEGIYRFSQIQEFGPMNLGNPNEISVLELAELVANLLNIDTKIEFLKELENDPQQRNPDINFAKKVISWEPTVDLEQGIIQTSHWIRERLK